MGLIVCFACRHQKEVTPIKKGKHYVCGNCHAKHVRIIRSKRHAGNVSWCDKDGVSEHEAKHQTYAGLKCYAESRGYKNGWCANKFRKLFGQWPNSEATEPAAPAAAGLRWWIRKENAEYARGRRLAELGSGVSMRGANMVGAVAVSV